MAAAPGVLPPSEAGGAPAPGRGSVDCGEVEEQGRDGEGGAKQLRVPHDACNCLRVHRVQGEGQGGEEGGKVHLGELRPLPCVRQILVTVKGTRPFVMLRCARGDLGKNNVEGQVEDENEKDTTDAGNAPADEVDYYPTKTHLAYYSRCSCCPSSQACSRRWLSHIRWGSRRAANSR